MSIILLMLAEVAAQVPLNLTCDGGGNADRFTSSTVTAQNNSGGSAWATVNGSRSESYDSQVDLRLFAGDDRVRLPRDVLPPIHGGDAGWFKMQIDQVDERIIVGKAKVNFANNPNIRIDRVTGTITISGKAGSFYGRCHATPQDAKPQF